MERPKESSDFSGERHPRDIGSIEITPSLLALLDLLERIMNTSNFDTLLIKILGEAKELMRVEASSIMMLDETHENLHIVVSTGPVKDKIKGTKIPADYGYAGWVVQNKKPVVANDVQQDDERFGGELSENFTTRNLICVPLFDENGEIMGVLEVINRLNSEDFSENELPIIQTLANHSARAIERLQAKKELHDVLKEHNLLLKEIHHRVKNDFALIAGIIEMERIDFNNEARAMLSKIQSRIETMSVVYDLLTDNVGSKIEVALYFRKLSRNLTRTLSNTKRDIQIEVQAQEFTLGSRPALYCGLLVNELLLNAFKHAFTDTDKGKIELDISKEQQMVTIIYKDDGKGLPPGFELQKQKSHGFEIIKALIGQLDGTIEAQSVPKGTSFIIEFEIAEDVQKKKARLF